MTSFLTRSDVEVAHREMHNAAIRTPLLSLPLTGIFLKAESAQRSGSFKFRGAFNALRYHEPTRVVTGSSGNHGIALALGAAERGVPCTVFMTAGSSTYKQDQITHQGGIVVLCDGDNEHRDALARGFAHESGATFISSHNDRAIIVGQGTVALEVLSQLPRATDIYVPVGAGGLLAGVCLATQGGAVRIVGVEPAGADAFARSLVGGDRIRLDAADTICDGVRAAEPGELAFETAAPLVDRIVVVSDDQVTAALSRLAAVGLRSEITGALALAGALADPRRGNHAVAVVTGGNTAILPSTEPASGVTAANQALPTNREQTWQ